MLKPVTQIPIISTTGDHSRAFSNKFPSTSFEATIAISTKLYSPNNAIPHQDPRENGFPCFGACINQRRIIQTEYKSRLDQQARHDPPNLNPLSLSLSLSLFPMLDVFQLLCEPSSRNLPRNQSSRISHSSKFSREIDG